MTPHAKGLIDIAKLSLSFAKVNRLTMHEDGERYESDTDHTVMLSLCACALASSLYKNKLDIGKVAQFALVHDLVEVYAGDTNTINISDHDYENKEKREIASLNKIESEFGGIYPWISETIKEYEKCDTKEAIFVKILDKNMTKITNILNHGLALEKLGVSKKEIEEHFVTQTKEYKDKYNDEFPELIAIMEELMDKMIKESYV